MLAFYIRTRGIARRDQPLQGGFVAIAILSPGDLLNRGLTPIEVLPF